MKTQPLIKMAVGVVLTLGVIALTGMLSGSPRAQTRDYRDNDEESLVHIGFEISPVRLNLEGKDRNLVGLGSFLVNAAGDCNGCHTGGGPPNFNYAAGGNPYFNQKTKVDPTVYLSGGQDFGPVGTPTGPSGYAGPDIIARNLTPDKTGRAEGGNTLAQFKQIMRNGTDFDHLHPTCTAAQLQQIEAGITPLPICIPTSPGNTADGNLLQVMPWPTFSNMTDHQLDAIYEYLSSIPCIDTMIPGQPQLQNDCGPAQLSSKDAPSDSRRRAKSR